MRLVEYGVPDGEQKHVSSWNALQVRADVRGQSDKTLRFNVRGSGVVYLDRAAVQRVATWLAEWLRETEVSDAD